MRTTVSVLFCILAFGAALDRAVAQGIVIDTNDVKAMFAVGTTTTYRADTLTTSADIGAPGATSWNFSGLATHTRMSLRSLVPSTTPYYASDFPTATHALSDTAFTYSFVDATFGPVTLRGAGYNYMTLSGDLLDHGFKGTGNAYVYGTPVPAQGQWVKSPAAVYYRLPMQMGTTWTTTFNETLSGSAQVFPPPAPPFAVGPTVTAHTVTYTVDAYGPLTVPAAAPVEALRLRREDRYLSGSNPVLRVSYMILAKNGASVQFTVPDTLAPASGTVGVTGVQWTTATLTSVRAVSDRPKEFGLAQNYPNPFNPSTVIRFTLPDRQQVSLKVFNLLGEEMATLVDQMVGPGEHAVTFDAARLATGVYLYRLQAGTATQTRRMVLVR